MTGAALSHDQNRCAVIFRPALWRRCNNRAMLAVGRAAA